jgi:serine O-acetyltransferase
MSELTRQLYLSNFLEKRIFFDKKKAKYWINEMANWLFCLQRDYLEYSFFEKKQVELKSVLLELIQAECSDLDVSKEKVEKLFSNLPAIHDKLLLDLNAILEFDPAAKSRNEVLIAYPGFFAILTYRIAHFLWGLKNKTLARILAEYAHSKTGIDIHPAAIIGQKFFIDHGTGVVIGETAIIGENVKIYQGVTLGALTVSKDKAEEKRHPTIEDNVIIYANATILGGKTVVGKDCVIGGNVWITHSIPPQSLVFHKSEIVVKNREQFPQAINFSI